MSDHCVECGQRAFHWPGCPNVGKDGLPVLTDAPKQCGRVAQWACSLEAGHEGPHRNRKGWAE